MKARKPRRRLLLERARNHELGLDGTRPQHLAWDDRTARPQDWIDTACPRLSRNGDHAHATHAVLGRLLCRHHGVLVARFAAHSSESGFSHSRSAIRPHPALVLTSAARTPRSLAAGRRCIDRARRRISGTKLSFTLP